MIAFHAPGRVQEALHRHHCGEKSADYQTFHVEGPGTLCYKSPLAAPMSPLPTIPSVKGFRDVLPEESRPWSALEEAAERVFSRYGFGEIRLPVVERTELFARSLGDTTDIVEKEMYSFADRDETALTLRPEGTAGVVRAYLARGLAQSDPRARPV